MNAKITEFFATYGPVLLRFVATLAVGLLVIQLVRLILKKSIKRSKIDAGAHRFVVSAVTVVLYFVLLIGCVDSLGVSVASFVAIFSAAGLALSLALQQSLTNIVSGVVLLFTRPFKKGDYVEIAGTEGRVDAIGLTYTRLFTFDNKTVLLPNSGVVGAKIIDFSNSATRRLDLPVNIGYGDSVETARRVILAAAQDSGMFVEPEKAFVAVTAHKDTGVELTARLWTKNEDYGVFRAHMLEQLLLALPAAGLQIPFNKGFEQGKGQDAAK